MSYASSEAGEVVLELIPEVLRKLIVDICVNAQVGTVSSHTFIGYALGQELLLANVIPIIRDRFVVLHEAVFCEVTCKHTTYITCLSWFVAFFGGVLGAVAVET